DRQVVRTNADVHTFDAWGIGRLRLGRGHADVLVNDTEREQGTPGIRIFPSTRARASFARRIGAVSSHLPCDKSGVGTVTASTSVLVASSEFDDPLRELSYGAASTSARAIRATESLRLEVVPLPRFALTPALSASVESLAMDLGDAPSLRAHRVA